MKRPYLFAIVILAVSFFSSCKKQTDYSALSQDAGLTQSLSSDMFKTVDNESKNGSYSGTIGKTDGVTGTNTCATVTLDINGGNFPMTLTMDFGSGCTDSYGVTRKGKLI